MGLGLTDAVLPEMEDRSGQDRAGMAVAHSGHEVVEAADAAGRDHRHAHGIRDGTGQGEIVARAHPIAVHGGDQEFAGPEGRHRAGERDGVKPRGLAAAMGEDLPGVGFAWSRRTLGVDGDDDALAAEFFRPACDEIGVVDGGRVDGDFVGPGQQQGADVGHRADAAADGERHGAGLRRAAHDIEERAPVLVARRDVEEAELVGPGRVVGFGGFHRIAGVAQFEELHALDHAAVLDVEAGDDAGLEHGGPSRGGGPVRPPACLWPWRWRRAPRADRCGRRRGHGP